MPVKRVLVSVAVATAVALVGYWLLLALRSDEDRVRALVEGVAEAFNEGSAGGVVAPLAEDFAEDESKLDRRQVQLLLARFFLQERDSKSRALLYELEVRPEDVTIELDGVDGASPESGKLNVTARFLRRGAPGNDSGSTAVVEFAAELKKIDRVWRISRAGHRVVEGKIRF